MSDVVFYRIDGMGHTWPGSQPELPRMFGYTSRTIDATRLIPDFFAAHALVGRAERAHGHAFPINRGASDPWAVAGPKSDLGCAHLSGARALGARLDLEVDPLAAVEAVEVEGRAERVAMEEVFLAVLGGDEAEAAVGRRPS